MRRCVVALALVAACSGREASREKQVTGDRRQETGDGGTEAGGCEEEAFAEVIGVAEASGAVWVEASFGLDAHLVVIGDSGTKGAFVVVDEAGVELGKGALPLGGAGDDLEGLARVGAKYVAITSGGQVHEWRRVAADRFELGAVYPVGEMACRGVNCGWNFEGLCLAEAGDGCDGYAASKEKGVLVCLELEAGKVRADEGRVIPVAMAEMLTGCDIAPEGDLLYAGNNLFGGNAVKRWSGWRDPATARAEELGRLGPGFGEAIAVGPAGTVYRFSDMGGAPSRAGKVSCPAPGR